MKICEAGALPIGGASGLFEVRRLVEQGSFPAALRRGEVVEAARAARSSMPRCARSKPAGRSGSSSMPGTASAGRLRGADATRHAAFDRPALLRAGRPVPAPPPQPARPCDARRPAAGGGRRRADLGLALDGDADRCIFVDETGEIVPADLATALMAQDVLAHRPGASILYDVRSSRAVAEEIERGGGARSRAASAMPT